MKHLFTSNQSISGITYFLYQFFYQTFSIYYYNYKKFKCKYQFFIIWFSRALIISFPPLLSAAQFHPMWKLTVLIKLCLSQIAFDLKGMISSLCSSARAGAWGLKDWPRGKKTTSRLSHTWKVFPKVQKTFILFMYNNFVRESDTPVASWVWLSHCPGHPLCTAVHHGSVFLWI